MIRQLLTVALFVCMFVTNTDGQSRLTVDKVYSAYLQNSGTIIEQGQIKGYFYLYQSDKIDRRTNEYTLQIVDENLNKVQDIKFEDTKKLSLLESAYNGSSLAFLFKNEEEKMLQMKVYDLDGKLKFTYSRPYSKKTDGLMAQYETMHTDEGMNQSVFNLGDKGYITVLPLRDGRDQTYEVDMYSSDKKKQWTYIPDGDDQKFAMAEYLGTTDSLVILEVIRKNRRMSGSGTAHLVGINPMTKKKVFDIDDEKDKWTFVPSSVLPVAGTGKFIAMGNYFDKDANIAKDASKGLAIYEIDNSGKILNKTYNSWAVDIAKHLPMNTKGKIDNIGYLYIHKMIPTANGKLFIVGEGYKKQASAGGIALTALGAMAGGVQNQGVTKVVVTDLVVMEFDGTYKIRDAKVYDKTNNTVVGGPMSDYTSQHTLAMYIKMVGSFDYQFTTGNPDENNFVICYSDWVKSSDYKGETFNSIRYNGTKFTQDKIELKSKASRMKVLPAKAGSVMVIEYFKKDKKLEFRLEKLG
ncbi:DUF6770 family protein [Chitinophaga silvisoli]|nr:DUF6770 family protein [Chitinophaga silvisoli]